jgi:ubiquinone/menaquinone biosynthesis C-methylase UbiE
VNYRLDDAAPTAGFTKRGRENAVAFLKALESRSEADLEEVIRLYSDLIPKERVGDEYTAFKWISSYLLSSDKSAFKSDLNSRSFLEYFEEDDFSLLKKYLKVKYEIDTKIPMDDLTKVTEYITFNNPNRTEWEHTEAMLKAINIREGEDIADVGCGSGYFTYRFTGLSGTGMVYATEINPSALSYVEELKKKHNLNITPVISSLDDVNLPENSVDLIYMCSMYSAVYISSIEFVKDSFIASIKKALRESGRLSVVDNDVVPEGMPEYFGSQIAKELVMTQLSHYGFKLKRALQFIPQRYILEFESGTP